MSTLFFNFLYFLYDYKNFPPCMNHSPHAYTVWNRKWRQIMSAKTKIVVLHMKKLLFAGVAAALGIIFLILLFFMLHTR